MGGASAQIACKSSSLMKKKEFLAVLFLLVEVPPDVSSILSLSSLIQSVNLHDFSVLDAR